MGLKLEPLRLEIQFNDNKMTIIWFGFSTQKVKHKRLIRRST